MHTKYAHTAAASRRISYLLCIDFGYKSSGRYAFIGAVRIGAAASYPDIAAAATAFTTLCITFLLRRGGPSFP